MAIKCMPKNEDGVVGFMGNCVCGGGICDWKLI